MEPHSETIRALLHGEDFRTMIAPKGRDTVRAWMMLWAMHQADKFIIWMSSKKAKTKVMMNKRFMTEVFAHYTNPTMKDQEMMALLDNGTRARFSALNFIAGRGCSTDLIVMDGLDDQDPDYQEYMRCYAPTLVQRSGRLITIAPPAVGAPT